MNLLFSLYLALLFVLLTPGVLVTLPPGASKFTAAVTHGLVFAVVYHLTVKPVLRLCSSVQGFQDMNKEKKMM